MKPCTGLRPEYRTVQSRLRDIREWVRKDSRQLKQLLARLPTLHGEEKLGTTTHHNGVPSLNWKSLRNLTPILILFNLHGVCFDFSTCSVHRPELFLLKERDLIGNVR